ncbi:MAG: hypothetical protein CEN89_459 [Candidatus Berkelbacteria bacterium Licking1014_7]|uniref:Uncharacterized protein n=1 Tax=Candidatus Berkelbacteria bacterium Licking1014_7 TaxID=2017147 RepID=A0A554LIT6_9BACT|nr:MAG: hypothetical protein CEN89_459 [Candidatus Berkelbacteria bacterium Licking1014_7]
MTEKFEGGTPPENLDQENPIKFYNDPPDTPKITHDARLNEWWVGSERHFSTEVEAEKYLNSRPQPKHKQEFSINDGALMDMNDEELGKLRAVGVKIVDHNNLGMYSWHYDIDGVRLRRHFHDYGSGESYDERRSADTHEARRPDIFEIHGPEGKPSGVFARLTGNHLEVIHLPEALKKTMD